MRAIWSAEQICGECGEGAFVQYPGEAICGVCGHSHPMDPWNLDENERFEWRMTDVGATLHVTAYEPAEV